MSKVTIKLSISTFRNPTIIAKFVLLLTQENIAMTKRTVCIFGHFGSKELPINGQSIKAAILADYLENRYSKDMVVRTDTSGKIKALFKIPVTFIRAAVKCKNIIVVPAYKGIRLFAFLISIFHNLVDTRYHYAVVGGWLPSFLEKHSLLAKRLHLFDGIYVETSTMKDALESKGYRNVFLMPNSKQLTPVTISESDTDIPLKLCTFSRVAPDKGISEAARTIHDINLSKGRTVLTLDIFGPVNPVDKEWFEALHESLPESVNYRGVVPFNKSVEVLKDYFMMLFPTKAFTEGVPGTIIDAYAAGLPVLASKWESYSDVIDEGVTGLGFAFGDFDEMKRILEDIISNPKTISSMRTACVNKSKDYLPDNIFSVLTGRFLE